MALKTVNVSKATKHLERQGRVADHDFTINAFFEFRYRYKRDMIIKFSICWIVV